MRKLLLLLSVAFSLGVCAQIAPTRFEKTIGKQNSKLINKAMPKKSVSRAANDGFTIQFCDDIYNWNRLSDKSNVTYKCYIYITPDMATTIAGNQITEITFSSASNVTTQKNGTVFVTESLEGTPTTSTDCKVKNSYGASQEYQTVALTDPYIIKENTGFYFGYTVEKCNTSYYPVGIDGMEPNGFSGTVELISSTGTSLGVYDMATNIGTNLFLSAKTVGAAKGFQNCFQLGSLSLGYFTLPVVNKSSLDNLQLDVKNIGANALTSIEYSVALNGVEGETVTKDVNVAGGEFAVVEFPAPAVPEGKNELTINVKKMNGIEMPKSSSAQCIALNGEGYDRKFVVEEGTGTWCGWCPRGIVGLDNMSAKYPEKFIGIAIHSGDDMEVSSYTPVINAYFSGFPSCIINRDPIYNIDPNFDDLDMCYSGDMFWANQRGAAKVDLSVAIDEEEGINVRANTTFAFSENNADYKLAFVILQDGMTGTQTNYYAGGSRGKMDGWETKGSSVSWTYKHTARDIFNAFGINNSIPATIVADQPMTFETNISDSHVTDFDQTAVVALILDTKTRTILNAAKVKAADYLDELTVGIKNISNSTAPVEYFDLSGMRVNNPAKGSIVIRRQGENVSKMIAQ